MEVRFEWNGKESLLERCGLEPGGRVQMAVDKAVIDWCTQYVPFDTGLLAQSPYGATAIGTGKVIYPGPYAQYLYYGEIYGPNIPVFDDDSGIPTRYFSPPGQKKHPTGRPLTYNTNTNPLAGSFWDRRMAADHLDDIIKEAQNVAAGKHN